MLLLFWGGVSTTKPAYTTLKGALLSVQLIAHKGILLYVVAPATDIVALIYPVDSG